MNAWYESLQRPPLTPPDWVFAPVWTVLYATIAVALLLWWRADTGDRRRRTAVLVTVHLLSNVLWTPLFFGLQAPALALVDLVVLVVTLVWLLVRWWPVRRLAVVLLLPYLLWVLFATWLNLGFVVLNS